MRMCRFTALAVLLLIVGWAAVGCGSDSAGNGTSSKEEAGDTVRVGREDAGSTVTLTNGQQLEVVLEGNPSTGYAWTLEPPLGSTLKEEGVKEVANTDASVVGAPSTYYFDFTAQNPGETVLNFLYKRPWETTPQDESITVTVVVQ